MSTNSKKGGYTRIVFGTTVGLSSSTPITGLLNGTLIGEFEGLTIDDAGGQVIGTGTRGSGIIRTSAVTAAFIATLEGHKNSCTPLWFRWYTNGSKQIRLNSVRVSTVRFAGAEPGNLHQYIIELSRFAEDSTDIVTIES